MSCGTVNSFDSKGKQQTNRWKLVRGSELKRMVRADDYFFTVNRKKFTTSLWIIKIKNEKFS